MAATELSHSSLAPTDFDITTSFEEETGVISVAVEACQLCGSSRIPFYCKSCVSSGDFCHSNRVNNVGFGLTPTDKGPSVNSRYADKLQRWHALKRERYKLINRLKDSVQAKICRLEKVATLNAGNERVALMKQAIEDETQKFKRDEELLQRLKSDNQSTAIRRDRQEEKKKRILYHIKKLQNDSLTRHNALEQTESRLCQIRRDHVDNLVSLIFSIEEIRSTSDSDSLVQDTVSALAEARHTSYIRGRWVYTENGSDHRYRVVGPSLPGNGDYAAYTMWLLENKETLPGPVLELGEKNVAYTIGAALAYTTQLVTLLAYFLDVRLPKRLYYSEFCGHELTERAFKRAVYKVNHNVLYLCFSQDVNPELLHPRHTIHNILVLLRDADLGRCQSFTINPELMQSIDETYDDDAEATDDLDLSSSEDGLENLYGPDELDACDPEWERVPVSLPESDIPTRTADSYFVSTPGVQSPGGAGAAADTRTTTSMAGVLVSSAAAYGASLWRGFNWK